MEQVKDKGRRSRPGNETEASVEGKQGFRQIQLLIIEKNFFFG